MKLHGVKRSAIRAILRNTALKQGWITSYFNAWELSAYDLNVTLNADYYSPVPDLRRLRQNRARWSRPSELAGLKIDMAQMKSFWKCLSGSFLGEFESLPAYAELKAASYGEGYTPLDAMTLYFLLRHYGPKRYLEVGAGLSTYYALRAAAQNGVEGRPMEINCIEPFPHEKLRSLSGINLVEKEVQEAGNSLFEALSAGDVLFIDSTHVLKIDGDVCYLYLEILPRLNKGVIVHIHDIPFPYNTPFPPETWVFERGWPVFWTEAMMLQAFLCHNSEFQIRLSLPMIRFEDEDFIRQSVRNYDQRKGPGPDTFSSIWLERI